MDKKESTKKSSPLSEEKINQTGPLKFTFEDSDYQFHPDAPEQILFDGKAWSQEKIIEDENILLQLIGGNLDLIIKI